MGRETVYRFPIVLAIIGSFLTAIVVLVWVFFGLFFWFSLREAPDNTAALGVVGAGTAGVLFCATFLPFAVGVLLSLRRHIWRCQSCGYFFDYR